MNKAFKKIITLVIAVGVLVSCFAFTAAAAGSTISFSNNKPKVNDSVTVTVKVNAGEAMYAVQFSVNYNADVLRFESGDSATGGAGSVSVVAAPSGTTTQSFSLNFTAIAAGSSTIQVTNGMYATDVEKSFTGASAAMTVSDATKSDNANLKSLSLSKGTLSPSFSASKTSYTASVANDVTEVKVYATAEDSAAKVEVSGSSAMKVGKNTRTVTVTAASGAQKTYTITITRAEEAESSSAPDTSEEPEVNPYETTVDGVAYTVATDISGIALPTGFTASTAEYNGSQVAVAKDSDSIYTVYYLKAADSETYIPYLLNSSGDSFEKLKCATFGDKTYIFADIPEEKTAAEGYYDTFVKIGNFDVKAFASNDEELSDLYYIYCFYDGNFRTYRYDSREAVLQRAPEFKLVDKNEELLKDEGFAERFKSLSSNAKIVVVGLLLVILVALALIILLIVKFARADRSFEDMDYTSDMLFRTDFDEVSVTDGENNRTKAKSNSKPKVDEEE